MTVNLAYNVTDPNVGFSLTARHNVVPVEVKSSRDYTTISLDRFKAKFPGYCAERIVLHPGTADFSGGITYLPLYMAPCL